MSRIDRRHFLKQSALAAGATFVIGGTKSSRPVLGANDRVRIAIAGLNGRGGSHVGGFGGVEGVEIAYLADPDTSTYAKHLGTLDKKGAPKPQTVTDIRKALEDKDVDAISIATPNHWHSLMTIWGAQHHKHVYVEKPMSHDVAEGRIAVAAQKKYGVVIQHGTQNRSNAHIAGLHEAIQAGKYGKLKVSYGYCCKVRGSIGHKDAAPTPANLDWSLWRGPAALGDYDPKLVHYNWHWFWKTGNGDLNNQGTHQLDIARWALDKNLTHPVRAMAIGGRFVWDDDGETPNTMFGIAEYANGQQVFFNVRNCGYAGYQQQVENEYYFEDGGKIVRDTYYPAGSTEGEKVDVPHGKVTPGGNWAAFIAAVRAGDPMMANGNAEDAHYGCVLGHLINNSYRLGQKVPFNAKAGTFGDNKDAHEHFAKLHDIMHKGVGVAEDKAEYVVGPWLTFDPETEKHVGENAEAANALLKDRNTAGFEIPDLSKV